MDGFVEEMKNSEQKLPVQLEKYPSERRVDGSLAKPVHCCKENFHIASKDNHCLILSVSDITRTTAEMH